MDVSTHKTNLTDSEIQAIIDDAERQALSGWPGAIVRAGLGTLVLVLAVYAMADPRTAGLILLCGVFVLGLGIYIGSVARSFSAGPHAAAPKGAGIFEPLGRETVRDADKGKRTSTRQAQGVASDKRATL